MRTPDPWVIGVLGLEPRLEVAYQGVNVLTDALIRVGFNNALDG